MKYIKPFRNFIPQVRSIYGDSSHEKHLFLGRDRCTLLQDKNQPSRRANRGSNAFYGWENL